MIADFYDTFEETPDKGSDIPQEVLDILSKELPSTFMYYRNENGDYVIVWLSGISSSASKTCVFSASLLPTIPR